VAGAFDRWQDDSMAFRNRRRALRRAAVAGVVGLGLVISFGPEFAVPAVALVALVYYAHQLLAVAAGDESVQYPSLAFVVSLNAAIILMVQLLLVVEGVVRA
jgi:hypothetical protein